MELTEGKTTLNTFKPTIDEHTIELIMILKI